MLGRGEHFYANIVPGARLPGRNVPVCEYIVDAVCAAYFVKRHLAELAELAQDHFSVADLQHLAQSGGLLGVVLRYAVLDGDAVDA